MGRTSKRPYSLPAGNKDLLNMLLEVNEEIAEEEGKTYYLEVLAGLILEEIHVRMGGN